MTPEILSAIVAGSIAVGGIIAGAGLTYLGSYFEYRRRKADEIVEINETESAVFHGAFALTNFLNPRLNDWDASNSILALAPLSVAQPYLAKLIERSPKSSDRLMVSLIGLGLSLEALLFVVGQKVGFDDDDDGLSQSLIANNISELSQAIETVEIIITGELPFMTEEELDTFAKLEVVESESKESEDK